jgi:hypothetical protein
MIEPDIYQQLTTRMDFMDSSLRYTECVVRIGRLKG